MKTSKYTFRKVKTKLRLRLLHIKRWWHANDHKYHWKWRLANATLALFLLASAALPIAEHLWQNNRYQLSSAAVSLVGQTDSSLAKQLTYDAQTAKYQFNKDAIKSDSNGSDLPAALQKSSVGAKDKSNTKTYALDVPEDFSKGVTYHDTNSGLSFSLVPRFNALNAKTEQGHVVFPLDGGNQAVYTLKNNGLKEDIIVPKIMQDSMTFSYELNLPDTLEARVIPGSGGNIGIYSADPSLFGDISYGSSKDQALVEKARKNGDKTFLVFGLPSPVITAPNGGSIRNASARFVLNGNNLSVVADQLTGITSTIAIDPSVIVTSTSDFQTNGNNEGMIDFSTSGQINRGTLTGGSIGTWATTSSISPLGTNTGGDPIEHAAYAAYNGYFYILGGVQRSINTYANVRYAVFNSDGTLGTWANTTSLPSAIQNFSAVAYNGYLYSLGGSIVSQGGVAANTYYAPIANNGTIGAWTSTTALPYANSAFAAAVNNGYVYMFGGALNGSTATFKSGVYYAPLDADGTIGTWVATTSLSYVRTTPNAVIYNGYAYIMAGANTSSFVADVQYAYISADGTLGSWMTTNSFSGARYGGISGVYNGYMYMIGGIQGSTYLATTQYAPINANGSLGVWKTSSNYATGRAYDIGIINKNYAYVGTGFDGTNDYTDIQYAKIDPPGMTQVSNSVSSFTTTRRGNATVVYNGFIYVIGGDQNAAPTATSQIMMATLGSDGTIGSYASQTAFTTNRTFLAAVAYGGYMYVFGGCTTTLTNCTTATNNVATVYSAPMATTTGAITTWTVQTSFTTARYGMQAVSYGGYVYLTGGLNGSTYLADTQYAQMNSGAITSWTAAGATFNISTARAGFGMAQEGGYVYVGGGCSAGTLVTCTTRLSDVQYAKLNPTGGGFAAAWASAGTGFTSARYGLQLMVSNGFIYIENGYDGTTYYGDTQFSQLAANGTLTGGWQTGQPNTNTAWGGSAVIYNGVIYLAGGINGTTCYTSYAIGINNGGSGTTGAWTSASNTTDLGLFYPSGVAYGESVAANGFLYYLGGQDSGATVTYAKVYYTHINYDGSLSPWVPTTSMNTSRARFGATVVGNYVYASNGLSSASPVTYSNTVEYAPILASGVLGAWTTSANVTGNVTGGQVGRQFAKLTYYNGYLYTAGGAYSGTAQGDTQYAAINSDGSVGTWTMLTGTSSFTTSRFANGVIAYAGYLYVIGGDTGSVSLNDVQYAPLNTNGGITAGSWKYTTTLNYYERNITVQVYNGYLYISSGQNYTTSSGGAQTLYHLQYSPVRSDGTIGNWQLNTTAVSAPLYQVGASIFNGVIYRVGGFDGTNAYQGVEYAPLNTIDRAGQYSKLIDLGSLQNLSSVTFTATNPQTLTGGLGAFTYYTYDSNGSLMKSGPASAIAAASGTACTTTDQSVRYVRMLIMLDDSQSNAIFPDSLGVGAKNGKLTDFTINYQVGHPTPSVRLRAGKTLQQSSATASTLSTLDTCGNT